MSKVRVYQLARELKLPSKDLIDILEDLGVDVKNHMSVIDADIAQIVADTVTEERSNKKVFEIDKYYDEDEEEDIKRTTGSVKKKPNGKRKDIHDNKVGQREKGAKDDGTLGENDSEAIEARKKSIEIPVAISVQGLSDLIGITPIQLLKQLLNYGVMININQELDFEVAKKVAEASGFKVLKASDKEGAKDIKTTNYEDKPENLKERPPVVTIMGHVDHGKTTLLDAIRETNVTAQEAGGITQRIGAYQVTFNNKQITFIDTPGHEAFTAMRVRGAQVTDIVILVVAADDGVMPQTVEAINHAKAAEVPIIVAINKIDRPSANIDRVKQELTDHGLIPEEWGGDTICVPISALKKEGLDDILDMILLLTDMEELKANPNRPAEGVIIESELDIGKGPVARALVKSGTLQIGDSIVAGTINGKVRAMMDHLGDRLISAGPSMPVEIIGFSAVPEAGDLFVVVEDDKLARQIASTRQEKRKTEEMSRPQRVTLDEFFKNVKEGKAAELNIVLKADFQGSIEALQGALERLSTGEVKVNIIHSGVGGINESDITLATASNAIVIGFNVRPEPSAKKMAEAENVDMRFYRIIYDVVDDVKAALQGLLKPKEVEVSLGRAEIRTVFKIPKLGNVAGSYVLDGKITRSARVRVIRDNVVVHEGRISSLKRFKDDVREVLTGFDCGIGVENFNDIKEGDIIEAFVIEGIKRTL